MKCETEDFMIQCVRVKKNMLLSAILGAVSLLIFEWKQYDEVSFGCLS